MDAELIHQPVTMARRSLKRDSQLPGNLFGTVAFRDVLEHFGFATSQVFKRVFPWASGGWRSRNTTLRTGISHFRGLARKPWLIAQQADDGSPKLIQFRQAGDRLYFNPSLL